MPTNRLSTVLLATIPLTGCPDSRARTPWGAHYQRERLRLRAGGAAARRCAGADGDAGADPGRGWSRLSRGVEPRGIGLIHGWCGRPAEEVGGGIWQDAAKPAGSAAERSPGTHCRAATGPAPSRTAVAETCTRMTWERRVLTDAADARVPPASACRGPAAVRLRARHERSQKRRAGPRERRPRRVRIPR